MEIDSQITVTLTLREAKSLRSQIGAMTGHVPESLSVLFDLLNDLLD